MARLKTSPKQRYAVAKFAQDVRRLETRNIGIILWTQHGLGCKFLSEEAASFVDDMKMYKRWTTFWRETVEKKEIIIRGGKAVLQSDPEFFDLILDTQRGGYLLYDAGHVTDSIPKREIGKAVDFLFSELVGMTNVKKAELTMEGHPERFDHWCSKIFGRSGLSSHKGFRSGHKIGCNIGSVHREFPVNYSLHDDRDEPVAIFQRVNLSDERSIDSTSFMFEKLQKSRRKLVKSRCASIYRQSSEENPISGAMDQLSQYSRIINADDVTTAARDVDNVAFGVVE